MKFLIFFTILISFYGILYGQTISHEAHNLKVAVDPLSLGRHRTVNVDSNEVEKMLKDYVEIQHECSSDEFSYLFNQTEMTADEKTAGTMLKSKVFGAVNKYLISWYSEDEEINLPEMLNKTNISLRNLIKMGAEFGFDGYWQNGCAAPTYYLLIIDKNRQMVEGIDLNPCEE